MFKNLPKFAKITISRSNRNVPKNTKVEKNSQDVIQATNELQQCLVKWRRERHDYYLDEKIITIFSILKELFEKGADVNYLEKERGFSCMAKVFWNKRLLQYLLDKGLDVNLGDENGDTALHLALQTVNNRGCTRDIINFLLEQPIDPNATNLLGETPLFVLSRNKSAIYKYELFRCKVTEKLLKLGADVATQNNDGVCLLHLNMCGYFLSPRFIAYFKCDIDVRTSSWLYNQTPLMLAAREGNLETCKMLISRGAQVNARDLQGYTALHHAVINGRDCKCAEFLMEVGADTNARSASGKDVYELLIHNRVYRSNIETWPDTTEFKLIGTQPAKEVEILEIVGSVAITKYLRRPRGFAMGPWNEAMDICKKFDLKPSPDFLINYEYLRDNLNNPNATEQAFISAMKTITRLSSSGKTKFWNLIRFAPTFNVDWCNVDRVSNYVFKTLNFLSDDLKRVSYFASLEETDFKTLYAFTQFFDALLYSFVRNHEQNEITTEIMFHLHAIAELTVACFNKRIRDTKSNIFSDDDFSKLYVCSCFVLALVLSSFRDFIPESAINETERLLRELVDMNQRDGDGNSLMHLLLLHKFNKSPIHRQSINSLLDLSYSINIVTPRNRAGFEPIQMINSILYYDWVDDIMLKVLFKMADLGAHHDVVNAGDGHTLREILEHENLLYLTFPYDSLKCACARVVVRSLVPYRNRVPKSILDFIRMHAV